MLPLMFAVRKLDGEDPNIVFMLRCAYGSVQLLIMLAVLYIYMVATKLSKSKLKDEEIYVAPPPNPFDPDAKTQYTKTTIGEQALAMAKKLGMSSISGIFMTVGLHWYKGMIVGLAMQTAMGPFNLFENPLAKSILIQGLPKDDDEMKKRRMFNEKYKEELTENDEIVDAEGKVTVLKKERRAKKGIKDSSVKSFEDILLDTWDEGAKADITPLMKLMKKGNVNYKTSESEWTPLMIMAAIGANGATEAMKKMKTLGASATFTDKEGWNALHWAAFHGCKEGAETIMEVFDGMKLGLHLAKDLEGMTPLDHAVKENNTDIASFLKSKIEGAISSGIAENEGLRKRK